MVPEVIFQLKLLMTLFLLTARDALIALQTGEVQQLDSSSSLLVEK